MPVVCILGGKFLNGNDDFQANKGSLNIAFFLLQDCVLHSKESFQVGNAKMRLPLDYPIHKG